MALYNTEYYLAAVLARWGANAMSSGASRATLAASNAGWMPLQDVKDRLRDAAFDVLGLLSEATANDDLANLLTTKLQIPDGTLLTDAYMPRVGSIASVRVTFDGGGGSDSLYKSAERDSFTRIREYRDDKADAASDIRLERYCYDYVRGRLYHTGTFAAVDHIAKPSIADGDAALDTLLGMIPHRYANAVIGLTVEILPIVPSDSRRAAGAYGGAIYERVRRAIAENRPSPAVEELLAPVDGG